MGEFDEADQILSHKLMADPKDFEALFGRYLCAGKWKSVKDIDLNDRMFAFHVRKLHDQLKVLDKRVSGEDQPHWEDMKKLSDLLSEYAVKAAAFNRVREKYVSICSKLDNTFLMSEEREDYNRQKNELYKKLEPLDIECTEMSNRVNEAMKALEEAGGDCVFFGRK